MRRLIVGVLALLPAIATGASQNTTLTVAGRSNATPSVAAAGDVVAVAWSATGDTGATDVFAAVSGDGAKTFGQPVRVNDVPGDARVNGEQPPRVIVVRQPSGPSRVGVVWTTKGPAGTRLVEAWSADGGRTFSRAATVPGSDARGNRGWENVAVDARGRALVVWLDHRELAEEMAAGHHEHGGAPAGKPDGVATAQKSRLYVASADRDGAVPPHPVAAGVCYCCKTAIAIAGANVFTAWRHVYPGNMRDIAFAESHDGGRTFGAPVRVSEDKWMLEGCPDDGPAVAVDSGGRVHVVWPTLVGDPNGSDATIALFYATSNDGVRFTPRERLPTEGLAHHPQIAIGPDDKPVIAWDEGKGGARHAVVAHVTAVSPSFSAARHVLGDGSAGVYPALAAARDAVVVAWTSTAAPSAIRVQRVPVVPSSTR